MTKGYDFYFTACCINLLQKVGGLSWFLGDVVAIIEGPRTELKSAIEG